jgi:hypothetical protein
MGQSIPHLFQRPVGDGEALDAVDPAGAEADRIVPDSSAVATMRSARSARTWRRLPMAHQVPGARVALGHAYGGGSQFFSMWVVSSSATSTVSDVENGA